MFDLTGRIALVTGAGQGVGAALSHALAGQGATVAVNDIAPERAEAVAQAIEANGGRALAVTADIRDERSVTAMVATIEATAGPVDVLVNNAGVPSRGFEMVAFQATGPEDWAPYLAVNVTGTMLCTRAVLGGMTTRGDGRIISIVSDAARVGEPGTAAYSAAKGGIVGFTRSLAKEVGRSGVTCNCVSLGRIVVDGPTDGSGADRYALRRFGRPEDIAGAVVWLASDDASWVTGQTIPVNGGYASS